MDVDLKRRRKFKGIGAKKTFYCRGNGETRPLKSSDFIFLLLKSFYSQPQEYNRKFLSVFIFIINFLRIGLKNCDASLRSCGSSLFSDESLGLWKIHEN
jgi:hypothetical protein